jgi:rubredoxin-NAD+ reductase
MNPITIIGSGLAGYTLAREFRKLDKDTPLVIITADDGRFYSKPMLSNAFVSGKTAEQLAMNSAVQMAAQLNATILSNKRVSAIDTAQHTIVCDGETLQYSKLVLALGADPIRAELKGDAADQVFSVNDLQDYARFRQALAGAKNVAIIGTGLIGCEFANDLVTGGYHVEVIDPGTLPLRRLLPQAVSEAMRDGLSKMGVTWHFGKGAVAVNRTGQGYDIELSDGGKLNADVVLSAIGLRPRTSLAQAAGIKANRGIATDRMLKTSAEDVYTLGDCAEVEGLILPFVMPIMHAARALAKTLSGQPTQVVYPAMPVVIKTPACPVVVSPPPANTPCEWQITKTEEGVKALCQDPTGKLLGFALVGKATAEKMALTSQLPSLLA